MPEPAVAIPVLIPLLNPNEPEARLVSLLVQEGEYVTSGSLLCTLETTKSITEILAEADGFVRGLRSGEGDSIEAGEIFCYLASSPDWEPPQSSSLEEAATHRDSFDLPPGLRITQPARELARQAGLDLSRLPLGPLITGRAVQELLDDSDADVPEEEFDPAAVIIFGGGGHGKTLIELIRAGGTYRIAGIIDDGIPAGESILGIPLLGDAGMLISLYRKGIRQAVNAIGGISNPAVRARVFEQLERAGFSCPALVHPSAVVEASAALSPGVQVFAQAYVGSEVSLGFGVIANTGVVVSHDCVVDDLANLSPGALLAGGVKIGRAALVGMGVTVNLGVVVGAGARLGNGATIKADVPEGGIVRAGTIWPG